VLVNADSIYSGPQVRLVGSHIALTLVLVVAEPLRMAETTDFRGSWGLPHYKGNCAAEIAVYLTGPTAVDSRGFAGYLILLVASLVVEHIHSDMQHLERRIDCLAFPNLEDLTRLDLTQTHGVSVALPVSASSVGGGGSGTCTAAGGLEGVKFRSSVGTE
jgi:hypothetical protein